MASDLYYPPPESQGGWRYLTRAEDVRQVGGMDPLKLDNLLLNQELLLGGDSWGVAIIRHGRLVREHYTFNVLTPTRFDVWSCTKSFSGVAWGFVLDDSQKGLLPGGARLNCGLNGECAARMKYRRSNPSSSTAACATSRWPR